MGTLSWYMMKVILQHLKVTVLGGLFFLIPILLTLTVAGRIVRALSPLGRWISDKMGAEGIWRVILIYAAVLLIVILICYLAGYLLHKGVVKAWGTEVEERLLFILPGLQRFRVQLSRKNPSLGKYNLHWKGIMIREDMHYRLGYITDENDPDYLTVYLPESPRMENGEIRIYPRKDLEYHEIPNPGIIKANMHFGRGLKLQESTLPGKT